MQATKNTLFQILNGNQQFIIPVFQRDYSWETEQCRQMWSDVVRTGNGHIGSHFLGSFVYVVGNATPAFSSWLVIDGQQRLTTLTLLLVALRDHIEEENWEGADPSPEKINDFFLKNSLETGDRHYKLSLRRHDNATLRSLVDGRDPLGVDDYSELIVDAYQFFRELLRSPDADPFVVYNGVATLSIVDVKLERPVDNPQLVFESLNSTGVDLSQSDLIRNYLLMGLPEDAQTQLYNDHWSRIESSFRRAGNVPDAFLRDYIALKQKSTTQARADRIYFEFKKFWQPSDAEQTRELLEDMTRYAGYYVSFLRPSMAQNREFRGPLSALRSGGVGNTHAPLVMRLFDCVEQGSLSQSEFIHALELTKSYLIRRAVLGLQTRNYWTTFARMAHAIDEDSPLESLRVVLARQGFNNRFPSDDEFQAAIQEDALYRLRICFHVLSSLENAGQKELSPTDDYSIEHIMPQSIADVPEWQQMLGANWEEVHETWLHRLGNLTLTAYNSEYSNRPFEDKKSIKGGFNDSAVRLNRYVREQDRWAVKEMSERGKQLAERAVEVWPYHDADEELVLNEEIQELQSRAAAKGIDSLTMKSHVYELLTSIQMAIRGMGDSIEIVEYKSLCFYDYSASFFAELLPMANYVRLLIPMDFDDIEDDPDGLAGDVTAWKFLPNVTHRDCGVFLDIWEEGQIAAAIRQVRQTLTSEGNAGLAYDY